MALRGNVTKWLGGNWFRGIRKCWEGRAFPKVTLSRTIKWAIGFSRPIYSLLSPLLCGDILSFGVTFLWLIIRWLGQPPALAAGDETRSQETACGDLFPASRAPARLGSTGSEESLTESLFHREITGKGKILPKMTFPAIEGQEKIHLENPVAYLRQDLVDYADLSDQCRRGLPTGADIYDFGQTMNPVAQLDFIHTIDVELRRRRGQGSSDWEDGVRADLRILGDTAATFFKEEVAPEEPEGEVQPKKPEEEKEPLKIPLDEARFDKLSFEKKEVHTRTIQYYAFLMWRPCLRLFLALISGDFPIDRPIDPYSDSEGSDSEGSDPEGSGAGGLEEITVPPDTDLDDGDPTSVFDSPSPWELTLPAELASISLYLVTGLLFSLISIGVSLAFTSSGSAYPDKLSAHECGSDPLDDARSRSDIRFYSVSLPFIIFDSEVTSSSPRAVPSNKIGWFGFRSMMVFAWISTIGSPHEWKKGALDWE